jgi:formate-dependent nitrite reductase cytochrome c552 subunit
MVRLQKLLEAERELPDMCFSVLPSDGSLICVKHGETGYYKSEWDTGDPVKNREIADYNNTKLGVSKNQEEAMIVKSMTGWASEKLASQDSGMEQTMGG